MDVRLAIASKRDHRAYDPAPIPADALERILDAGRVTGSARNRQPWRFLVAESAEARSRLAVAVYVPAMLRAAPVAVVVAVEAAGSAMSGFDAGRAAQNIMLAAWDEGIASCPNGIADPAALAAALPLGPSEVVATVLALGYPARRRDPARRTPEEWSRHARRHPLADLVVRLG